MNHARTLVYIAGPFTGKGATEEQRQLNTTLNITRAERLGIEVAKAGAYPIIPHCNTQHSDFEEAQPYSFWIDATGELLRRCDAVLFTDDWETSAGARGENEIAIDYMIPRFFHLSDLIAYLNQDDLAALGVNWGAPTDASMLPDDPDWLPTLRPPAPRVNESEADWWNSKRITGN